MNKMEWKKNKFLTEEKLIPLKQEKPTKSLQRQPLQRPRQRQPRQLRPQRLGHCKAGDRTFFRNWKKIEVETFCKP